MLTTQSFLLDDLSPLPAAANFIDIDHYPRPVASVAVDKSIKASLAEVSLTILDGTPTISDEVVVGIEDPGTVDEDPVGDDTILADGAVLTVNEVEEVLRDAFAETDRLVPTPSTRGTTSVGDHLSFCQSVPSFGCVDIGFHPSCRGTKHPHATEVGPERYHPRVFRKATSPRTNNKGNYHFHPKISRSK